MNYKHCPRCEINYIAITEDYCEYCQRELRGENLDIEVDYCAICGIELDVYDTDICRLCHEEVASSDDAEVLNVDAL